jgi:DegV family protein with EDD domain
VTTARQHPYVLGTSAAEFATLFSAAGKRDREILAVMTSRKVIGSHDAAVSAARALARSAHGAELSIRVADSGVTDLGAGMATVLACEAHRAGKTLAEAAELVDAFRRHTQFSLVPSSLDYLVKGGRATMLRAWIANLLNVRPHVAMIDGVLEVVGKVSASADRAAVIAEHMAARVGARRPAWIGVFHGGAPDLAERLRAALAERFDVRAAWVRPLAPSIYLHMGRRAVGAVVTPLDALPWSPPALPDVAGALGNAQALR